jgi:hypothetical protein
MAKYVFASLAHSTKYGYIYDSDAYSRSPEICSSFRRFETYGDGMIQHTGDLPITQEFLGDYLGSLAAAMLTSDEMAERMSWAFRPQTSKAELDFAASVAWRESDNDWSKRRYVSVSLQKIGTRSKEHDKRYTEITRYMDGTCASISRLLISEYATGFARYCLTEEIRNWANEQKKHPGFGEGWAEWFDGDWSKANEVRISLAVCRNICESVRLRNHAAQWLENKKEVLTTQATEAA